MVYFFAGLTIVLLLGALRDEFRKGGSLHIDLVEHVGPYHPDFAHDGLAELIDITIPAESEWSHDDVVRTYAEIQAL